MQIDAEVAVEARTPRVFTELAFQRDCEIRELEILAATDPALNQVANSAIYSPRTGAGNSPTGDQLRR